VSFLDLILNLAALLLWLNWRAVELSAATQPSVLSLASALKRAEPRPTKRRNYLVSLVLLLAARSLFYWKAGPPLNWTPLLPLGTVALPFHSDSLLRMFLFSTLSFIVTLGIFYLGLVLLSVVNRKIADSDPIQRIVRLQLGGFARLPLTVQIAAPALGVAVLWLVLNPPLARMGLVPSGTPLGALSQQSLAVGLGVFLCWKYFIAVLLAAYSLNSYVYLGNSPVWNFVSVTGRNLLAPLRWLPLGIGKADLAPAAGIVVVLVAAHFLGRGLTELYQRPPF